jgi:hypothetical protein
VDVAWQSCWLDKEIREGVFEWEVCDEIFLLLLDPVPSFIFFRVTKRLHDTCSMCMFISASVSLMMAFCCFLSAYVIPDVRR